MAVSKTEKWNVFYRNEETCVSILLREHDLGTIALSHHIEDQLQTEVCFPLVYYLALIVHKLLYKTHQIDLPTTQKLIVTKAVRHDSYKTFNNGHFGLVICNKFTQIQTAPNSFVQYQLSVTGHCDTPPRTLIVGKCDYHRDSVILQENSSALSTLFLLRYELAVKLHLGPNPNEDLLDRFMEAASKMQCNRYSTHDEAYIKACLEGDFFPFFRSYEIWRSLYM